MLGPQAARQAIASALRELGCYFSDRLESFEEKIPIAYELPCDTVRELPRNWEQHPLCEPLLGEGRSIFQASSEHARWGLAPPAVALPLYIRLLQERGLRPISILGVSDPAGLSEPHQFGSWLSELAGGLRFEVAPMVVLGNPGAGVPDLGFDKAESARFAELLATEATWADAGHVPDAVRRAFQGCCDGTRQDELLRDLDMWRTMLAPPKLPGTRMGFAWHTRGGPQSALEPFMPGGDWQTVRLLLNAPPRTEVNGLLYCRPCRVWIRQFQLDGQPVPILPGPGSHLSRQGELIRLDGAYEARQITFRTPNTPGPHRLSLDFYLEAGPRIAAASVARSAENLHRCLAHRARGGA